MKWICLLCLLCVFPACEEEEAASTPEAGVGTLLEISIDSVEWRGTT